MYSKRNDQRLSEVQFQFINIRNQPGTKKNYWSERKARSNKCDLSSFRKASREFADLAPKGNEFHNLGPATEKQELKCFLDLWTLYQKFKIISSQEFIGRFAPPCTNRWTIWYNKWTEIWWHTIDHGFVGDKT